MSHNDWERGSYKLSTAEFSKFRNALVTAYNKALEQDYKLALKMHAAVKAAAKGKRGVRYLDLVQQELSRQSRGTWSSTAAYEFQIMDEYAIRRSLLGDLDGENKLLLPKKANFQKATVGLKCLGFPLNHPGLYVEGHLSLDPKTRQVFWSVSENNHAVDRARESFVGHFLFSYLAKVVWTRGTGGFLSGNDEYNEDDREAGGAANYLKSCYGPIGEQEREAQHGVSMRSLRRRPRK